MVFLDIVVALHLFVHTTMPTTCNETQQETLLRLHALKRSNAVLEAQIRAVTRYIQDFEECLNISTKCLKQCGTILDNPTPKQVVTAVISAIPTVQLRISKALATAEDLKNRVFVHKEQKRSRAWGLTDSELSDVEYLENAFLSTCTESGRLQDEIQSLKVARRDQKRKAQKERSGDVSAFEGEKENAYLSRKSLGFLASLSRLTRN